MRQQLPLRDGWYVRELPAEPHDPLALSAEAAEALLGGRRVEGPWLSATMPAQVHDVLLAHGRLVDPHVGRNAEEHAWVAERDWAYACAFPSPEPGEGPVFLRFRGLDTLAGAYLNGEWLGDYANMFREHVAEVSDRLSPYGQSNVLLLVFRSVVRHLEATEQPPEHRGIIRADHYVRKSANDFSAYLGARPRYVKVGVYRDVVLDVPDRVWIDDLCVRVGLSPERDAATLRVTVPTSGRQGWLHWALLDATGSRVAAGDGEAGRGEFRVDVDRPHLWWPHTHGEPYLYTLRVELTCQGVLRDVRAVAVGIRTVRLEQRDPNTLTPVWRFLVNRQPLFLQGAGWAPVEGMTHVWKAGRARRLLELAEGAGMNVLRVWGGGLVPDDSFYDECDRRGILVWQDFCFGYGMYPDDDPAFVANVRGEAEDIVRRLRNHPCLLVWVGGNENHMGYDFGRGGKPTIGTRLFGEVLPDACRRLDPTRPYHPSSPYGGRAPNWPLEGDWHDYTTITFSHWASVPLLASETGRASAPSLDSMRRFLSEEELWPAGHDPRIRAPGLPAWPPMWQYRSVDGSWEKVGPVERYCDPLTPRDLIRVLGTAHGEYLRERIERERRGQPDGAPLDGRRCWGNLVWRLNDPWPTVYWAVVDYYLEPKVAYYYLRRAYAPVLLSFEHTPDELHVWVVNDSARPVRGTLRVRRVRFDGTVVAEGSQDVDIAPGQARRRLDTVDLGPISLRHEFLLAELGVLRATYLLTAERYLCLPEARLEARLADDATVELGTNVFARQVSLEADGVVGAVFEDNYFDMTAGETRAVRIVDAAGAESLTVRCVNGPLRTLTL